MYQPLSEDWVRLLRKALWGWQLWSSPRFYGLDRLPDEKPLIFVGNHTMMGAYDVPFMVLAVWDRYGKILRGLADPVHFRIPGWRYAMRRWGALPSTRENYVRLIAEGDLILNFPGGGREVSKSKGERYQLHWQRRLGFARLAVEFGCTIVPFSMVGADDAWDIVMDADQILESPLGDYLRRKNIRRDQILPWVAGVGGTIVPRPGRLYFNIGTPIRTEHLKGQHGDTNVVLGIRDQAQQAVEEGIAFLRSEREQDPGRTLWGRIRSGQLFDGGGR